jgi:L-amino acid N-acyltransferase YncA
MEAEIRPATTADAAAVARIYNQGIEEREATFETRLRTVEEIERSIANTGDRPFLVAHQRYGEPVGWARLAEYSARTCYAGIGEASVYIDRAARGQGLGRRLLEALAHDAERRGYWKILGLLFPTNRASLALVRAAGFTEVGVHARHGRLDGRWRDVMLVELLLPLRRKPFTPRSGPA